MTRLESTTEDNRLAALHRLEMMFSAPEEPFDRVTTELARVFDVPAAQMSLINHDTCYYKSAFGLPPELSSHRSVPRALSICGTVIDRNEALVVPDIAEDARFCENPILKQAGVRFYAGTPLQSEDGHAIGTLCILDSKPRDITPREQDLLKMIAAGLMTEVKLRSLSRELIHRNRVIEEDLAQARVVQRFLLPPTAQSGDGFILCHAYHPFDAIGGDFVDFHVRQDGSVVALLADVSGHGASAALTSAMIKTIFQRAATTTHSARHLLTAVNRDLAPGVGGGRFATAIAMVFEPTRAVAHLAVAGHPPPALLRNKKASPVEVPPELPLLIDPTLIYQHDLAIELSRGDRLVLFTDGAIEAANSAGKFLDPIGLFALLDEHAHLAAEPFVQAVFHGVRAYADAGLKDDVAILSLERS